MAYASMTIRPTGYVVPSAEWNEIVNNFEETAPAKAVAAGDLFYATGLKVITRLALGTQGHLYRAGASAPELYTPDRQEADSGTNEGTRTSAAWGDPSGMTGPTITLAVGPLGQAWIHYSIRMMISTSAEAASAGVSVDGADPTGSAWLLTTFLTARHTMGKSRLFTGLSQGNHTFKLVTSVSGGTGTFGRHAIAGEAP